MYPCVTVAVGGKVLRKGKKIERLEPELIREAQVAQTAMSQSQAASQEICFKNMISPKLKITSNIW